MKNKHCIAHLGWPPCSRSRRPCAVSFRRILRRLLAGPSFPPAAENGAMPPHGARPQLRRSLPQVKQMRIVIQKPILRRGNDPHRPLLETERTDEAVRDSSRTDFFPSPLKRSRRKSFRFDPRWAAGLPGRICIWTTGGILTQVDTLLMTMALVDLEVGQEDVFLSHEQSRPTLHTNCTELLRPATRDEAVRDGIFTRGRCAWVREVMVPGAAPAPSPSPETTAGESRTGTIGENRASNPVPRASKCTCESARATRARRHPC